MVEITAIAGALNSLKIALDLTKGAMAVRDANLVSQALEEIRAKLIEAQMMTLQAHQTISALIDSERELKRQLVEFEQWERDKENYELVTLSTGGFAYALKPSAQGGGPAHYICPSCAQKRQKSIMQPGQWAYSNPHIACPVCKLEITR